MWDEIKDIGIVILITLGIFAGSVVVATAVVYPLEKVSCSATWEPSGMVTKYTVMGGCQVSKDGGKTFLPAKAIREVE